LAAVAALGAGLVQAELALRHDNALATVFVVAPALMVLETLVEDH